MAGSIPIPGRDANTEGQQKDRNNDRTEDVLGLPPQSPLHDDTLREDLCIEEHSYQPCLDHPTKQESDDGLPKLREVHADGSTVPAPCHIAHKDHLECTKPHQSPTLETLSELPLPSPDFQWNQRLYYSQQISLSYKGKDSGIQIWPQHTGVYLVILGDRELIMVPTLRQAQAICHIIGWIFRDNLPVPRRHTTGRHPVR
jgi:hypothetical protein